MTHALKSMVCIVIAASGSRGAPPPHLMLRADLSLVPARWVGMEGGVVVWVDDAGLEQRSVWGGPGGVVGVMVDGPIERAALPEVAGAGAADTGQDPPPGILPWDPGSPLVPGVVVLTDGERWRGSVAHTEVEDALGWVHPTLGRREFPLGRVARVVVDIEAEATLLGDAGAGGAKDKDSALLRNGDLLAGFVERVGSGAIDVDVEGTTTRVPLASVIAVGLSNPAEPPRGTRVWLGDGSVVGATLGSGERGGVRLRPGGTGEGFVLRPEAIAGVLFGAGAMAPLASLEVEGAPTPAVGADNMPLGLRTIELPGVGSWRWVLPAGATGFACEVSLPAGSWAWGDCELVVLADGGELARATLSEATPERAIRVEFGSGASVLELRLEEGAHGPVQDRAVLSRARVGVAAAEGEPDGRAR